MYREEALRSLRLLAFSERLVKLDELIEASIVNPTTRPCLDIDDRGSPEDILNILSGLVVVDETTRYDYEFVEDKNVRQKDGWDEEEKVGGEREGNVERAGQPLSSELDHELGTSDHGRSIRRHQYVRLAHYSVKEYLTSNRAQQSSAGYFHLDPDRAHQSLSHACFAYIGNYGVSPHKSCSKQKLHRVAEFRRTGDTEYLNDLAKFPFLEYAIRHCWTHARHHPFEDVRFEVSVLKDQNFVNAFYYLAFAMGFRYSNYAENVPGMHWPKFGKPGLGISYACFFGLTRLVQGLLASGQTANDEGGFESALMSAIRTKKEDLVETMIEGGADIRNAIDPAITLGTRGIVQTLIRHGAGEDLGGSLCNSILRFNDTAIVEMLIERGAAISPRCADSTPDSDHPSITETSTNIKAAYDYDGHSALCGASFRGTRDIVAKLIEHGADVNNQCKRRGPPLISAIVAKHLDVVELLIDRGAEVNTRGEDFRTPLCEASAGGRVKIAKLLLDRGAHVDAEGGGSGEWPMGSSVMSSSGTRCCQTPLRSAVIPNLRSRREMMKLLIAHGADIDARASDGDTALDFAIRTERLLAAELLIECGATLTDDNMIELENLKKRLGNDRKSQELDALRRNWLAEVIGLIVAGFGRGA